MYLKIRPLHNLPQVTKCLIPNAKMTSPKTCNDVRCVILFIFSSRRSNWFEKLLISQFYWDAFASKTLIYLIGITSGLTIKNECAILLSDYACHYLLGNNMVVIIKLSVYSLCIVYNQNIIYTFFFVFL